MHIRSSSDERYQLILDFLRDDLTSKADVVFLLGDIFDLLVGSFDEYIDEYSDYFSLLKHLSKSKKIVIVEGNHDFHFQNALKKAIRGDSIKNISYIKDALVLKHNSKFFYFTHGDDLDYENETYVKYKKLVRSPLAYFLANYVLTYNYVLHWKDKLQKKSRDLQRNFDFDKTKQKYRQYSEIDQLGKYDYLVCGHSHVLDSYNDRYFNNGFFPETKKFIYYDGEKITLKSLY